MILATTICRRNCLETQTHTRTLLQVLSATKAYLISKNNKAMCTNPVESAKAHEHDNVRAVKLRFILFIFRNKYIYPFIIMFCQEIISINYYFLLEIDSLKQHETFRITKTKRRDTWWRCPFLHSTLFLKYECEFVEVLLLSVKNENHQFRYGRLGNYNLPL